VIDSGNVAGIAGTVTRRLVLSAPDVVKARGRWKHGTTLALQLPITYVNPSAGLPVLPEDPPESQESAATDSCSPA
jgi:hypothetical protein